MPFPIVFRVVNRILSFLQPLAVDLEATSFDYRDYPPRAVLEVRIYEKRTGRGAPSVPYTIYMDGEKYYRGVTDREGESIFEVEFTDLRSYTFDAYVVAKELGRAFDTEIVDVFMGRLYNDGACWWWIGRPYCMWFDVEKPSPRVGNQIWFLSFVKNGTFKLEEWRGKTTLSYVAHVDHILTAPSGRRYTLWIPMNDQTIPPGGYNREQMGSCVGEYCGAEPTLGSLNESGVWKLTVKFYGTTSMTGPVLLDEKEVTFRVS